MKDTHPHLRLPPLPLIASPGDPMSQPFANLADDDFTDVKENGYYTSRRAQIAYRNDD